MCLGAVAARQPLDLVGEVRVVGVQRQRARGGVERAGQIAQVALAALGDAPQQLHLRVAIARQRQAHLGELHRFGVRTVGVVERLE